MDREQFFPTFVPDPGVALEGRNTARVLGGISVCEAQRARYTFGINSTRLATFIFPLKAENDI